jgi:glycosyltransferase involved in cell wall biosynthesis
VRLACENLGRVPDSEFFAPELERHRLPYAPLETFGTELAHLRQPSVSRRAEEWLKNLPPPFTDALWPYVKALLALRPRVVHAWQDQTSIMAGVAARIVGVPRIILSTRNVAPTHFAYHQPHMRASYQVLSSEPSVRLINNSVSGAADYASWLGVPTSSFTVVHNGFNFDGTAGAAAASSGSGFALNIPAGAPVVGSIFRFYHEKDPILWIEAAAVVATRRPDAHFVIVGTGPLEHEARMLAGRYGFANRLHLPGTLPDPSAVLRAMTVFLLTSQFEGLPNVLIEAQSYGVPVVCTRAGGSCETFLHGETGWLVDEREPTALAERILCILDDASWRERCRALAPRIARERFAIGRMLNDTVAVYGLES